MPGILVFAGIYSYVGPRLYALCPGELLRCRRYMHCRLQFSAGIYSHDRSTSWHLYQGNTKVHALSLVTTLYFAVFYWMYDRSRLCTFASVNRQDVGAACILGCTFLCRRLLVREVHALVPLPWYTIKVAGASYVAGYTFWRRYSKDQFHRYFIM